MELPKYIQDKIKQQNKAVFKAWKLEMEIDEWCENSGINIYSEEYQETKAPIKDSVGPVSGILIQELYEKHNNLHSK